MKRPSEQELLPVHAITILYELRLTLYLLLLPAARALIALLRGTLEAWLRGTVFDFLVLLAALLVPVLRWKACRYQYAPEGLYLKRGVLWQRRYFVPDDSIVSVEITSPFFLRPFGAVRLKFSTAQNNSRRFGLVVPARQLIHLPRHAPGAAEHVAAAYVPETSAIAWLSLFASRSLPQVILIISTLSRWQNILTEHLDALLQTAEIQPLGDAIIAQVRIPLDFLYSQLIRFLPPVAAAVTLALLGGWVLFFLLSFLRYKNMRIYCGSRYLDIRNGVWLNRWRTRIRRKNIAYADIRQSLICRLIGHYYVYVHAAGLHGSRDCTAVVLPAVSSYDLRGKMRLLTPVRFFKLEYLRPNRGAFFRYTGWSILAAVALTLALLLSRIFLPISGAFTFPLYLLLMTAAVWYIVVMVLGFLSAGLAQDQGQLVMRYARGYRFHTVVIPKEQLARVTLRQSVLQAFDDKVDVIFRTQGRGSCRHVCKNLDRKAVEELLRQAREASLEEA